MTGSPTVSESTPPAGQPKDLAFWRRARLALERLIEPKLLARLGAGTGWILIGAVFNQGSTLLVNVLVANLLGRKAFGGYAVIQSTIATASTIASFGAGYIAIKYLAELRSTDKARAGRILGLCLSVAVITGAFVAISLVAAGRMFAANVFKAEELALPLSIAAVVVFFNVISWAEIGALTGLGSYSTLARAGILTGTAYFVVCGIGTAAAGLTGAFAGMVVSGAIQVFTLRFYLVRECARQGIAIQLRGLSRESSVITRFAIPTALPGLTMMPAIWIGNVLLVRQPGGYSSMALYSAATTLRVLVLFLPALMNSVGLSLLNEQRGLGNRQRYAAVFRSNLAVTLSVTAMSAAGVAILGRSLLRVFGRDFVAGYPVLLILLIATVPEAMWYVLGQIPSSRERMWLAFTFGVIPRDLCMVGLAWVLVPSKGPLGLAYAYAISWSVAVAMMAVGITRRTGWNIDSRKEIDK
jgi:O-antigen/teichoic acid export membrane protein